MSEPPLFSPTHAEQMAKTMPGAGHTGAQLPCPAASGLPAVPSAALPAAQPSVHGLLPLPSSQLPPPGSSGSHAVMAHSTAPVSKGYTGTVQFQSVLGQRLAAGSNAALSQPALAYVRS